MKKIHLVLTALAITLASAGVFATNALTITYYKSAGNGGTNCDTSVTPSCQAGTRVQCNSTTTGAALVYFIDTDGTGACEQLLKP